MNHSTGLVHSQTSVPRLREVTLDTHQLRLHRLRRTLITAARMITQTLQGSREAFRCAFLTFTYRPGETWTPRDISDTLRRMRKWLDRQGVPFRYVWVLELTKAGTPHYHVVVWLPPGVSLPFADQRGWWTKGLTRTEWARNPVGYVAKYASKGTDGGTFPPSARVYGVGGLGTINRRKLRWWMAPAFVRDLGGSEHRWRRQKGGGWVSQLTGEWVPPPLMFSHVVRGDGVRLVVLVENVGQKPPPPPDWDHLALVDRENRYERDKAAAALLEVDRISWIQTHGRFLNEG